MIIIITNKKKIIILTIIIISQTHIFIPVALEAIRPMNAEDVRFLYELGERLVSVYGDPQGVVLLIPTTFYTCATV